MSSGHPKLVFGHTETNFGCSEAAVGDDSMFCGDDSIVAKNLYHFLNVLQCYVLQA